MDNLTKPDVSCQANDHDEQVIEVKFQLAVQAPVRTNHLSNESTPHGLRFNNPDPLEPRQGDQQSAESFSCSNRAEAACSWPSMARIASGCPTKELEQATKRFFSVVGGLEKLRKSVGVLKWADVPKTLHNVTAVANYLFIQPSINRLFDSVLDVQKLVETCWSSL